MSEVIIVQKDVTDLTIVDSNSVTFETASVGPQGAVGATGPANTLSIGTVASGVSAAATITGTAPTQTLNLTLPKGDTGNKGDIGLTGPRGRGYDLTSPTNRTVAVGSTVFFTTYDKDGNSSQGAYFVGTKIFGQVAGDPNRYFYGNIQGLVSTTGIQVDIETVSEVGGFDSNSWVFQIPGIKGDTGDTGTAATATAGTTTTVDGYTSALVTNSNSTSAAVFDFRIPNGVAIGTTSPSNLGVLWADTNTSPTITAINGGTA